VVEHKVLKTKEVVILIVIFIQGVHSAYADFQWSPDHNSTLNIMQYIYIRKIYRHLQQFMNYRGRLQTDFATLNVIMTLSPDPPSLTSR